MTFVGIDGESEPWRSFFNFCVSTNGGWHNEWFLSLFIWVSCLDGWKIMWI